MGIVLVFDMDQTILDSSDPYLFERPDTPEGHVILKEKIRQALNWNVVNLMKRATKLRHHYVSAIFLLTNNSSTILVSAVDEVLYEETGSRGKYKTYAGNANDKTMPEKPYFFDSIMMRQHSSRPKTAYDNPPKRFEDVKTMLKLSGIEAGLDSIYFFDDIGNHVLKEEFETVSKGNNYIQIKPPYSKYRVDETDYSSVLTALNELDGEPTVLPPAPAPAPPPRSLTPPAPSQPRVLYPSLANLKYPPPGSYPSLARAPRPSLYPSLNKPSAGGLRKRLSRSRKTRTRHRRSRFTRRRK